MLDGPMVYKLGPQQGRIIRYSCIGKTKKFRETHTEIQSEINSRKKAKEEMALANFEARQSNYETKKGLRRIKLVNSLGPTNELKTQQIDLYNVKRFI